MPFSPFNSIEIEFFNKIKEGKAGNIEFLKLHKEKPFINQSLQMLYSRGIMSVIIEGGTILMQSFIDSGIWDEARIFKGNNYLKDGIKAPTIEYKNVQRQQILNDELLIFFNHD